MGSVKGKPHTKALKSGKKTPNKKHDTEKHLFLTIAIM